ARLRDVLHAVTLSVIDVVAERNEPVRNHADLAHFREKLALLLVRERFGRHLQCILECVGLVPGEVALDVADAPVDAILLLQTRLEAQPEHLGMAPELPGVRLLTGELGAVDPRLLASTDADHLTAYRIADGVRL